MTPAVKVLVRAVHGLEWVAADELAGLIGLGPDQIRITRRELEADLPSAALDRLTALRCADDVLLPVGEVAGIRPGQPVAEQAAGMARALADLDWEPALSAVRAGRALPDRAGLDVVAAVSGVRRLNRFAAEQAVGPVLARRLGARYLQRGPEGRTPGRADLTVRLLVDAGRATAAVRLAEQPLHRRGYKQDTGPGTLHPPVAAALARLAGPLAGRTVLDPFCGDGTVVIEAALSATGSAEAAPASVAGADLDPARVRHARANAERAGVRPALTVRDATLPTGPVDRVLTNPPWNLAVDAGGGLAGGLSAFVGRLPDLLVAGGLACLVTEADLDLPRSLTEAGFALGLAQRLRISGRVVHLTVVGAPGGSRDDRDVAPPDRLARWRARALAAGVVTDDGF